MFARFNVKFLIARMICMLSVGLFVAISPVVQSQTCPYTFSTTWPSSNPVWALTWATPDQSVGVDGSGLQLTGVLYKDKQVFHMAHLPVLNVLYEPGGGCGDAYGSHRDWQTG